MRRWPIAAVVAGLALALAGAALAYTFTQSGFVKLTAATEGASSGITSDLLSSTNPAKAAPWAAKTVRITFPAQTKFGLQHVPACKATNAQLKAGKSCPSSSKVGSGTADAYPVAHGQRYGVVSGAVTAFVRSANQMVLVVRAAGQNVVVDVTTSGNVLSIRVPKVPYTLGGTTFDVVLTRLKLKVDKRGSGRTSLIRAGECVKGNFVVKTHFAYTNGKTRDLTSKSPCF